MPWSFTNGNNAGTNAGISSGPGGGPVQGNTNIYNNNGSGGVWGTSPGVQSGSYGGTGMAGYPNPSGMTVNPTNWRGNPTYGAGTTGWRSQWNGDPFAIQGAAGAQNLGQMNYADQAIRDAQHRAQSTARNESLMGQAPNGDISGSGMNGQQRLAQIQASQQENDASNAAQLQTWQTSLNPAQLGGYNMSLWSPQQLQAGTGYYQNLMQQAVPGSNEYNMYQDYLNSIQQNMGGNHQPVSFPSQMGPGYFNNNPTMSPWGINSGGGTQGGGAR